MTRELGECQTFNPDEQEMSEPENEDFFYEVVNTSLKTKKKGYTSPKKTEKNVRKAEDEQII